MYSLRHVLGGNSTCNEGIFIDGVFFECTETEINVDMCNMFGGIVKVSRKDLIESHYYVHQGEKFK